MLIFGAPELLLSAIPPYVPKAAALGDGGKKSAIFAKFEAFPVCECAWTANNVTAARRIFLMLS